MRSDPGLRSRVIRWVLLAAALWFPGRAEAALTRGLEPGDVIVAADTSDTHGIRVAMDVLLNGRGPALRLTEAPDDVQFRLMRHGRTLIPELEPQYSRRGLRFVVTLDAALLARLRTLGDLQDAAIVPDRDFAVTLSDSLTLQITPDQFAEATRGRWPWLTDSLVALWRQMDVVQTGALLGNHLDVGRRTGKDANGQDVFAARFSLDSPFLRPGNVFHVEGDWSTVPGDSSNHLHVSPLNVRLLSARGQATTVSLRSGIECGRLGFTRQGRAHVGLELATLAPNLLDLTGGAPRWRLRPIVTASVQVHTEWSDHDLSADERSAGLAAIGCSYDIPVLARQTLRVQADAHVPLRHRSTRGDIAYAYSVRLLTEALGGSLQPVLAFSNGADSMNRAEVTRVLLGLWLDLIPATGN